MKRRVIGCFGWLYPNLNHLSVCAATSPQMLADIVNLAARLGTLVVRFAAATALSQRVAGHVAVCEFVAYLATGPVAGVTRPRPTWPRVSDRLRIRVRHPASVIA